MIPVILETGEETTVAAIRAAHPNLMFGVGSDLSHIGIGWLVETPPPGPGYTRGPNELVGGEWRMTWIAPPPQSFEERQSELIRAVDLLARDKRNDIVADISPAEMASWPIKRAEALAYQVSGLEADAPSLAVEADARNISLPELVAKVLAKAAQLSYIEAQIAGYAGKLQDQVNAAEDQAALDAIDITAGWPA